MMQLRREALLAVAGACVALSGTAAMAADNGPRYTYGEIGYSHVDFDDVEGVDLDGDAWYVSGSVALTDMFHLFAGYTDGELDVDGFDLDADYNQLSAGIGINYAISDTIDVVGKLAYVSAEVDVDGFGSADEDGYGLSGGLRAMVMPQFELNAAIVYSDLGDDIDSETSLNLGAVYSFTDMVAATAGVSFSDDSTSYGIGARLYFGDR